MIQTFMTSYDIFVTCILIGFAILVGFILSTFENKELQKHFKYGLFIKLFGGFSFALVYTYYYDYGGDTRVYYSSAQNLTYLLFSEFDSFYSLFFLNELGNLTQNQFYQYFGFGLDTSEFTVIRITSLINILGFNSYFGTTIVFAFLSFFGIWIFYRAFVSFFPFLKNQLAFPFLYFPSVFFWGSGISKDTIVIGFMGLIFFFFLKISKKINVIYLLFTIISGYIIFQIKSYIILSIIPVLGLYYLLQKRKNIKNKLIKTSILPVVLSFAISISYFGLSYLGEINPKYSVENVISTSQQMQSWHYVEGENSSDNHGRGSSYTLGEYDPSILGVIGIAPSAINVALFRPYFWEVKNAGMLAAAIESLGMLIFSIIVLLKVGPRGFIQSTINDNLVLFCIIFSLIFLFFVGFSSYNFGALMRYKIPAIPFYLSGLIIILHYHKNQRLSKTFK